MPDPQTEVERIADFIRAAGIPVSVAAVGESSFLPGIVVRDGGLIYDPVTLAHPGDLLHEAGHIAVTPASGRVALATVSDDPAEEMAAIAWSYAAVRAIGLDPAVVFHDHGYRGGGSWLIEAFAQPGAPGVAMLSWYGMTATDPDPIENRPVFPHMARWLR